MKSSIAQTLGFAGLALLLTTTACQKSAPPSSREGAEKLGTFMCQEVKDKACTDHTDSFAPTVPMVYMTYRTTDIPKNGDVYKIQWIAEDVGSAAPANTVIDTVELKATDVPSGGVTSYTVNSHLSRPTKGWPTGTYRVEVKMGDKLVTTSRFKIG